MAKQLLKCVTLIGATALAGCGGSPFILDEVANLETQDPNTQNSRFLFDPGRKLTMNSVVYDEDTDELVINNLPFDGPDGRYDFVRGQGGAGVYQSRVTATTGQIQHYAVYMSTDNIEAAAAGGRDWSDFGFTGAHLERHAFALPGGIGEYVYVGNYAGIRTLEDQSGLQITTGNAQLLLDILDFDNNGEVEGAIVGTIGPRTRTDSDGSSLSTLPSISLATVSFDPATGIFLDGAATTAAPDGNVRDAGTYEGVIAGSEGEDIGVMLVMTGTAEVQEVTYQVIEWEDTANGTSGSVFGLNGDNRDAIQAIVDSGGTVGFLTADFSEVPAGATTTLSTETEILTSDFNAQEVGVVITSQAPTP
ncbi:MAG: hypothetical protein MK180_01920 [Rhodobacteraceae bacterium]|nr:hypothetical protein [Paracoccaceae bacterium]